MHVSPFPCGGQFADLIAEAPDPARIAALRAAETMGRPLGAEAFLERLAALTGRDPRPGRRGRKPGGGRVVAGAKAGRNYREICMNCPPKVRQGELSDRAC